MPAPDRAAANDSGTARRGPQVHREVADLLHSPRPVRGGGHAEDVHVTGADLHARSARPEKNCPLSGSGISSGVGHKGRAAAPVAAMPARRPRCSLAKRIAIEPSPTAEATLLTEPLRTSPTAKTPGWLASSKYGSRPSSSQAGASRACPLRSGPVTMKPLLSSTTDSASHCVWGSAPIRTNRAVAGTVRRAEVVRSSTVTLLEPPGLVHLPSPRSGS